jgi:hypothetical protein
MSQVGASDGFAKRRRTAGRLFCVIPATALPCYAPGAFFDSTARGAVDKMAALGLGSVSTFRSIFSPVAARRYCRRPYQFASQHGDRFKRSLHAE